MVNKRYITNVLIGALMLAVSQPVLSSSEAQLAVNDVEERVRKAPTPAKLPRLDGTSVNAGSSGDEQEVLPAVCGEDLFK